MKPYDTWIIATPWKPYVFGGFRFGTAPALPKSMTTETPKGSSATRRFRVEGHGAHTLLMVGNARESWGFHRTPYLTREEAWAVVQDLKGRTDLHTIKVFDLRARGESTYTPDEDTEKAMRTITGRVWACLRIGDGSWCAV